MQTLTAWWWLSKPKIVAVENDCRQLRDRGSNLDEVETGLSLQRAIYKAQTMVVCSVHHTYQKVKGTKTL